MFFDSGVLACALEKLTSREQPGREVPLPFVRERNIHSKRRSNRLTTFWALDSSNVVEIEVFIAKFYANLRTLETHPRADDISLFLLQPSLISHPSAGGTTATAAD